MWKDLFHGIHIGHHKIEANQVVFSGMCEMCKYVHFAFQQKTLVLPGDELGQTFSHHPELGIIGNNQEVYKFTKSIEECEQLCLMSANYTCMSADYMNMTSFFGGHECYLSTVTYMNVSTADRTVDSHGWILTERECL